MMEIPSFQSTLEKHAISFYSNDVEIFQINLGKMCNLACKHCHVEAGPKRKEIMDQSTVNKCLELIDTYHFKTIDLTGGAPEMNPNFRWFVKELGKRKKEILVRSNLVILLEKEYEDIISLFAENNVTVIASLPNIHSEITDRQRGNKVFDRTISAIQLLNQHQYGIAPDKLLHLVYNPVGAYLPGNQASLEKDYKKVSLNKYNIVFNSLFCITNMPIGRYLWYLEKSGNYMDYMIELVNAFNPSAANNVMCLNTLSIGYDGSLFDCDFNQMIRLPTFHKVPKHINDFDINLLSNRKISIGEHCYGCTAGSGSSCQGATA